MKQELPFLFDLKTLSRTAFDGRAGGAQYIIGIQRFSRASS
jgi:hypothetical protein